MSNPTSALYEFAITIFADVDFAELCRQIEALGQRGASLPPIVELYGRSEAGEITVLYRFPFAAYSAALRRKMEKEAQRLKGRLVEPELLASDDRDRFHERLKACDARVDVAGAVPEALEAFRAKMGLLSDQTVFPLHFASLDDILVAWARCVAEGSLFVPSRRQPAPGSTVGLLLCAPGQAPLDASGHVLEVAAAEPPGFLALMSPGDELQALIARRTSEARQGRRRLPDGGRRRDPRFESCLEVRFEGYPALRGEYASNISRGGLFVRTVQPPPLRSQVRLRLVLPDEGVIETAAEVVHVVGVDEARQNHCSPGVGLSFLPDPELLGRIEKHLGAIPVRRSRALIVDDDRFFREVLSEALTGAGIEVETAGDGKEALEKLAHRLFDIDLVVLDLQMPDLDGYCLIDRIRRLGGELDLRIVVLSAAGAQQLAELKGPGGVTDAIRKGTPLEEIVRRVSRALGA